MAQIGYHCSHEQYDPSELLTNAIAASTSRFEFGMCSDHFHPWSERQGNSGAAWPWLGAALAATSMSFGTVCAPGDRYHPAIIAQSAATLAQLYPERFWLAVGTGEALNENITGADWPTRALRKERLAECVDIIRQLWAGNMVSHDGLVKVKAAKLYSRPSVSPLLIGACLTPESAEWVGTWADGLITVAQEPAKLAEIVQAYRSTAGDAKPMFLQVALSYADTYADAERAAMDQWRQAGLENYDLANLNSPLTFDQACKTVTIESLRKSIRISADLEQHLTWLQGDLELGFDRLYLHNVNRDQTRFISRFAEKVLSSL